MPVWSPSGATAWAVGGLTVNWEVVASTLLRVARFDEDNWKLKINALDMFNNC